MTRSHYYVKVQVIMKRLKLVFTLFVVLFAVTGITAQNLNVTGVVKDTQGEPLIGVTIRDLNANSGVVTNIDGEYSISIPKGTKLLFSYVGMKSQTIEVTQVKLDVVMEFESEQLDELVVVGYETMRKRDITGSVVSVSGNDINSKMTTSALDALKGQVAGVQISASSGQPGETSSINIRGIATFSDNAVGPLYIVDGVQMDDINAINPADIESLEVLKDAASASIYGSRSANGVIIITTKQGTKLKPMIDIRYSHSISNLSHRLEQITPQLLRNYLARRLEYANNEGKDYVPISFPYTDIALLTDTTNFMFNSNNDYQKLAFKTGNRDQIDASIGGGADNMNYQLNAGYLSEKGIIHNTSYDRLTTRLNSEYKATKKLNLISRNSFSYSKKKGIDEFNYLNNVMRRLPTLSLYYPDGSLIGNLWGINPLSYKYATNFSTNYNATIFQALNVDLTNHLKFTSNISARADLSKQVAMTPSFILNAQQTTNNARAINILNTKWSNENYFNYYRVLKGKHHLSSVVGFSMDKWNREVERIYGKDSPSDDIYTMNAFVGNLDLNNTNSLKEGNAMMSYFFRGTYNYLSRYIISINYRADGSSRFSNNTRWGHFPSLSIAWRVSDEKIFANTKEVFDDIKIRSSIGKTGNQSIGNYDYMMLYDVGGVYDDIVSLTPYSLGLSNLKWEETSQFNIGLDMRLFDRINLTFDYYNKYTEDLLTNYQLPKEIGFNSIRRNIGSISNKGFEFLINGDLIRTGGWLWNMSFNIAKNDNKIIELSDGKPYLVNSTWLVQEGGKIGDFYGYKNLGVFQYDESNAFTEDWQRLTPVFENEVFQNRYLLNGVAYNGNVHKKTLPNGEPFRGGDIDWDNSHEAEGEKGVINDKDRQIIGNAQPKLYGGLNSSLDYKSFSLLVSFYYSLGGELYNQALATINSNDNANVMPSPDFVRNTWIEQGDVAKYPRPVADYFQNNRTVDSYYIEDASYIRLQNVRLGYSLPSSLSKKISLRNLELFVYCNNVLTWTKYSGFDPEVSSGSALEIGMDTNRYPKKREFGIGTSIRF